MQYYNFKQIFGRSDEQMAKDLPGQKQWGFLGQREADAGECIQCGKCEEACTQHLNIIERLGEIAQWEATEQASKKG